ncbi:MAG: glycine cleavage system aminomethyltransferase GcvT [Candidatus Sumerlaeia bacterium]|nr:glycine cleavage system aminomethyltransferase GcvT [Candidatus Sumerlaeia bacterium]
MPVSYAGQLIEHQATRQQVGIFDVSHMGQVVVAGNASLEFLQNSFPSDFSTLKPGSSKYTFLLNDRGGVVDDLIVTALPDGKFFLVVNAANLSRDLHRLGELAARFPTVSIENHSEKWAMIAVQGPKAMDVLDKVFPANQVTWGNTPPFTLQDMMYEGSCCQISRTGYTGEHGAEVLCPPSLAPRIWKTLVAEGCVPSGLAARDSLRLEAGYPLHGNDLSEDITPVEAGLSWAISWNKTEAYPGREILEAQKKDGPPRRRIALVSQTRKPFRKGEVVTHQGREVGVVTSGGYSPGRERGIALALVDGAEASHDEYTILSGSRSLECSRSRLPFVPTGLKPA